MASIQPSPELVLKDMIPSLKFSQEDVLVLLSDRQRRKQTLHQAVALGLRYQSRVKIVFKTESGKAKRLYTTVWALNKDRVTLTGGDSMPVRSIVSVNLF